MVEIFQPGDGGGGGEPALPFNSVQFNNAGVFGGSSELTWDNTLGKLLIGPDVGISDSTLQYKLSIKGNDEFYIGASVQNLNSLGTSDYTVSADNDSNSLQGHYADMGIAGSAYPSDTSGSINSIHLSDGGTGYHVNDILTLTGGGGNGQVKVLTVNGGGKIVTIEIFLSGTGYVSGSSALSTTVTPSGGTGAKVVVTGTIDTTAVSPGTGYFYVSGGDMLLYTGTDKPINFSIAGSAIQNKMFRMDSNGAYVLDYNDTPVINLNRDGTASFANGNVNIFNGVGGSYGAVYAKFNGGAGGITIGDVGTTQGVYITDVYDNPVITLNTNGTAKMISSIEDNGFFFQAGSPHNSVLRSLGDGWQIARDKVNNRGTSFTVGQSDDGTDKYSGIDVDGSRVDFGVYGEGWDVGDNTVHIIAPTSGWSGRPNNKVFTTGDLNFQDNQTFIGNITANSFIKSGGTSSQFLKADGSTDSTSYQATLVSGTNIKTINSTSLLGSGNITVSASASGADGLLQFASSGALSSYSNLKWDNTNHRLGIGTTSPYSSLHVFSGGIQSGTTTSAVDYSTREAGLIINRSDLPTSYLNRITGSISGTAVNNTLNFEVSDGSSGTIVPMSIRGDNTIRMFGPTGPLISGPVSDFRINMPGANGTFRMLPYGNDIYFDNAYAGGIHFRTDVFGTIKEGITVLVGGNVGILNSSPSYALDVTGDTNTSGVFRKGGTAGMTTTVTTASLVGKTMTFSGGILTGFS